MLVRFAHRLCSPGCIVETSLSLRVVSRVADEPYSPQRDRASNQSYSPKLAKGQGTAARSGASLLHGTVAGAHSGDSPRYFQFRIRP